MKDETEKTIIGKTRFLELLESEPKYTKEGGVPDEEGWEEKREEWTEQIAIAFNEDVLHIFEEGEHIQSAIEDLQEMVVELTNKLSRHKHLPTGEAVTKL